MQNNHEFIIKNKISSKDLIPIAELIIPSLQDRPKHKQKLYENMIFFLNNSGSENVLLLKKFIILLKIASFIMFGRSYTQLGTTKRLNFFSIMDQFPIKVVIAGLTGLRTLICISYYTMEEVWSEIGYEGPTVKGACP